MFITYQNPITQIFVIRSECSSRTRFVGGSVCLSVCNTLVPSPSLPSPQGVRPSHHPLPPNPPITVRTDRERETERQRDKETKRQRDRETKRQRDKETEKNREGQRKTEKNRERQRETD